MCTFLKEFTFIILHIFYSTFALFMSVKKDTAFSEATARHKLTQRHVSATFFLIRTHLRPCFRLPDSFFERLGVAMPEFYVRAVRATVVSMYQ